MSLPVPPIIAKGLPFAGRLSILLYRALIMAVNPHIIVGAYYARTHLPALLDRVEAGEEITITRHGVPVAKLAPLKKKTTLAERRAAIERIRQMSKGLSLGGLKIRDLINEGRR